MYTGSEIPSCLYPLSMSHFSEWHFGITYVIKTELSMCPYLKQPARTNKVLDLLDRGKQNAVMDTQKRHKLSLFKAELRPHLHFALERDLYPDKEKPMFNQQSTDSDKPLKK